MKGIYEYFATWGELIADIKNEADFSPLYLPGDEFGDCWVLDNEFYRDKHGKLVEDWIFTLNWDDENGQRWYEKVPSAEKGYPTLEEALTAKLFEGESIKDLYERNYNWFDYSEEWYTDENGKRIPRKSELTPR